MQRNVALTLTLTALLALGAGCNKEEVTTTSTMNQSTATTPVASSDSTTAASIEAKLTAAGFATTTKDETEDLMALPSKGEASKATRYRIKGAQGNIDVTVIELTQAGKSEGLTKDINAQWAILKTVSTTTNVEFVDVGSTNMLVTLSYKTADKDLGMKVKGAIAKN